MKWWVFIVCLNCEMKKEVIDATFPVASRRPEKIRLARHSNPWPLRHRYSTVTNWANKPAGRFHFATAKVASITAMAFFTFSNPNLLRTTSLLACHNVPSLWQDSRPASASKPVESLLETIIFNSSKILDGGRSFIYQRIIRPPEHRATKKSLLAE